MIWILQPTSGIVAIRAVRCGRCNLLDNPLTASSGWVLVEKSHLEINTEPYLVSSPPFVTYVPAMTIPCILSWLSLLGQRFSSLISISFIVFGHFNDTSRAFFMLRVSLLRPNSATPNSKRFALKRRSILVPICFLVRSASDFAPFFRSVDAWLVISPLKRHVRSYENPITRSLTYPDTLIGLGSKHLSMNAHTFLTRSFSDRLERSWKKLYS